MKKYYPLIIGILVAFVVGFFFRSPLAVVVGIVSLLTFTVMLYFEAKGIDPA